MEGRHGGELVIGRGVLVVLLAGLALGSAVARGDTSGAPVSTSPPEALGSPGVGKTTRATEGSWSPSGTFTYQWVRCGLGLGGCTPNDPSTYTVISAATSATYVPVAADVGHFLAVLVTATNAAGSASVLSSGLGPVEVRPPGLKQKPWIRGTKRVGQLVNATEGAWTRAASSWTFHWLRCSAKGNACVRIEEGKARFCVQGRCSLWPNPAGDQYKLVKRDAGHRMRVTVTAWNGAGGASSTSDPTRIVKELSRIAS